MTQTGQGSPPRVDVARRGAARSRLDILVLGAELALVAAAAGVGAVLNRRHVPIHAAAAPLYADWLVHAGPGTPLAILVAVVVVYRGPVWARLVPWRPLMAAAYPVGLAWAFGLALVNGWTRGFATRLTQRSEYLYDVPKVAGVRSMLSGFTAGILDFTPVSWAAHTAGHPPGVFLIFVVLREIGLGGGVPAALLCLLVGATAPVSIAATVRALGDESAARTVLPFLVLFPGAVWAGASADGLFTGVVAAGLALLAVGRWPVAFAGGLLLGYSLYLSYGLLLVGPMAVAVVALRAGPARRARPGATTRGRRARGRWAGAAAAAAGVAAVVAAFTASGFCWLTGYHLLVRRYYQGWAAGRPYGYWVWADLACLVVSAGPVIGPALRRTAPAAYRAGMGLLRHRGSEWRPGGQSVTVWLPVLAALAIVVADLSGLSKAEVERIWLPYGIWLLVATVRLPARYRTGWLAAQALTALAVDHLLLAHW